MSRMKVEDQVGDQVWHQVRDQVRDQAWDQVGRQVVAQVGHQVWDQVGHQVWNRVQDQLFGFQECMLSFYDYFLEICKLDCCKPLEGLLELSLACGWWAPYKNAVIFQHRPEHIYLSDRGYF